jgi:5-methylcytosine-specific restriction endonuclease McrA
MASQRASRSQKGGMSSVLVLNVTYEPLNIVSLRRAVVLLLKDKAEILEASESRIRAERLSLPVPLVIRLVYYVRVPHHLDVPCTRRTVMIRDNYTCQYCGATPPRSSLTIDHVLPKVRGGQTTWENVVCACQACNLHKGSRTPQEANMLLRSTPGRPRYLAMVLFSQASMRQVWSKYLPEPSLG